MKSAFEETKNMLKKGKLPTDSFYRLGLLTQRRQIQDAIQEAVKTFNTSTYQKAASIICNHPLDQIMTDYITSMEQKRDKGHVNYSMAQDKINFTTALKTFINNPNESNWHNVRKAMHENPRYGFSWTGMSQADYFLTIIKIQYKNKIDTFDANYLVDHKKEAQTSWGRFVYNFGFVYYIPSAFLALYKLVQFIYHEGAREYYHHQLANLKKTVNSMEIKESTYHQLGIKDNYKTNAIQIIKKLDIYLNDDDWITQDVVDYIDKIDYHINALGKGHDQVTQKIRDLAAAVKQLTPRPVAVNDTPSLS